MAKLQLSVALAVSEQRNNLTRLILEGAVCPDGIDLIPSDVYSGELIWKQLRSAEFDIAQMSVTALLMLAERVDFETRRVDLPDSPLSSSEIADLDRVILMSTKRAERSLIPIR